MKDRILVTGGTGLIGRYLQKEMPNAVYVGSSDYNLTKNDVVVKMFQVQNQLEFPERKRLNEDIKIEYVISMKQVIQHQLIK